MLVEPAEEPVPWLTPTPGRTPGAAGQLVSNDFGSTTLLEWPAGAFDAGSTITYAYRAQPPPPGRWGGLVRLAGLGGHPPGDQ